MFIKLLTIKNDARIFREIKFHSGLNLIIDESENQITGNNVGKTTVLKLVDFCLGADSKIIYADAESKKNDEVVKNFLVSQKIVIRLELVSDLNDFNSEKIIIERNFLGRKDLIRKINGMQLTEEEFETMLGSLIFPNHQSSVPSFRQIISHNVRYKDESLNNTLNTLYFGRPEQYEALYLFLFGCDFQKGNGKQEIISKIKQEDTFKKRLEKSETKSSFETALAIIESDIHELDRKKKNFNLNEEFEQDLNKLNNTKFEISKISSILGKLNIRKDIIKESENELLSSKSEIDLRQLETIYNQATSKVSNIQKSFSDLVTFHNKMIEEKIKFITKELPEIDQAIDIQNKLLEKLLQQEKKLTYEISKSDSFEELELVISELTEKYRKKGEYEKIIQQLNEIDSNLNDLNIQLDGIEEELFSNEFEQVVKTQLGKFNKHFASISDELYGEKYAVKHDIITNSKGQKLYKFTAFNANMSSGKKQGEISCFDIAYILFANEENFPCLHFILNDKKELMHDNQLVKIAEFANRNNIQFIASILKDKLPAEINREEYFITKLSQSDKLFRIESLKLDD